MTRQQRRKMEREEKKKRVISPNVIVFNFTEPNILEMKKEDNKLHLTLKRKVIKYNVTITRIGKKGYIYEDVGILKRTFNDVNYMLWEYELPKHLKSVIESLPIGEGKLDEEYVNTNLLSKLIKGMIN